MTSRRQRKGAAPCRPRPVGKGKVQHLPLPKHRLRNTLGLLIEVADDATQAALGSGQGQHRGPASRFDLAVLGRGVNALKAVHVLCEQGHWEFAVSPVRQLFELLVNLEHIDTQDDRAAALERYELFGMLQHLRQTVGELEYEQSTGRPVDEERLAEGRRLLDAPLFERFRVPKKKGEWHWATSWSGKTVWELAKASSSPIRRDQYRLLFSVWSEQTHASPSAVMQGLLAGDVVPEVVLASDDVRIAETVASAIAMFLEVWHRLPTIPPLDPVKGTKWFERMLEDAMKYGGKPKPESNGDSAGAPNSSTS